MGNKLLRLLLLSSFIFTLFIFSNIYSSKVYAATCPNPDERQIKYNSAVGEVFVSCRPGSLGETCTTVQGGTGSWSPMGGECNIATSTCQFCNPGVVYDPPPNYCITSQWGRAIGCQCDANSNCSSMYCNDSHICANPPPPTSTPTTTPTPTITPTPTLAPLNCTTGSVPVVVTATNNGKYCFAYSGQTIPVSNFATTLASGVSALSRGNFPAGTWKSWYRPSNMTSDLVFIETNDLLCASAPMGTNVGLCMKSSYQPGPTETQDDGFGYIITTSPPPSGTTTYNLVDATIPWTAWPNNGYLYRMRVSTTTPTPTTAPLPSTCDPDKSDASNHIINDLDFAWWKNELLGVSTYTNKLSDCKQDNIIDIFDFNKMRDLRWPGLLY